MRKIDWTLGCDPEVFLVTDTDKPEFYSAFEGYDKVVYGTKEKPEATPYGAIQIDGMAVEFNTKPVSANNTEGMWKQIVAAKKDILSRYPGMRLARRSVFRFDPAWLDAQPKAATEMGCDPDYNAYTGQANPPPKDMPMRTAGGHLHIGWTKDADPQDPYHLMLCKEAVRALDKVHMKNMKRWPQFTERSELYGARGSFRPKPYGVEYRVPSNFWIHNKRSFHSFIDRTVACMDLLANGNNVVSRYRHLHFYNMRRTY